MSALNKLEFVKRVPRVVVASGLSPVDRARDKLVKDINTQIELANNPNYEIVKETKKRDGTVSQTKRKPKSWIAIHDGVAYITVRYSNKPVPLGGKRGSVIKSDPASVVSVLETVKQWAQSDEATDAIEKLMKQSRRKKKSNNATAPTTLGKAHD